MGYIDRVDIIIYQATKPDATYGEIQELANLTRHLLRHNCGMRLHLKRYRRALKDLKRADYKRWHEERVKRGYPYPIDKLPHQGSLKPQRFKGGI